MSKIAAAEDWIMARVKAALGNHVRQVEWAPPDWNEDFIKRLLSNLPAALLIFGGGQRINPGGKAKLYRTVWTVVAATKHTQDPKARARGDHNTIGCYQIIEAAIAVLDGEVIPDIGTLEGADWENDIALKLESQALMVQSAAFEMVVELSAEPEGSELVPFLRFFATYDIGQPEDATKTEDHMNLPQ